MQEERPILGVKSNLLYSEIALARKPFEIGHMYIYAFLLRMTDKMPSQYTDLPPGIPFVCVGVCVCVCRAFNFAI
jgi:hypothetical protein